MNDAGTPAASGLPSFRTHPLREAVLGEIHARPFRPLSGPRVVLLYAFTTSTEEANADHAWFSEFCRSQGAAGPGDRARYHTLPFAGGTLSWERHAEFITYIWDGPLEGNEPFGPLPSNHPFKTAFRAPGPLLSACRLDLVSPSANESWRKHYDPASLTVFKVEHGGGTAATDFRPDGDGLTRYVILNESMSAIQCGAVAQRLLEIETYRTLALLGLFEANRLQPLIGQFEIQLFELTQKMQENSGLDANRTLLDQLSSLATALEASAAESAFRFGASRAYYEIVNARLSALEDKPSSGGLSLSSFLSRRLAPAMRTCQSVQDRQRDLSEKLARATTLLRTRVDVDLEQQNRSLLQSMNRRARIQLRLQQTVEGLSVAAVSYYVVGLIGYLAKAAKGGGLPVPDAGVTTGLAVPVVVAVIWYMVRRIRKHHADSGDDADF
ncbi:DUF3422 family protein [Roseibium sediminis]|uniref:DUF3422 family protein n=1 Tax=Roseibium sediminis TaxID=1775174 RepID=UPI00123DC668|nr:DUF3422 domain-containing protein [Roseibium sediminis]